MRQTLCTLVCILILTSTAAAQRITLEAVNPLDRDRPNAICVGQAVLLAPGVAPGVYEGTLQDGNVVAVQLDDVDGNGVADEVVMVLDLPAGGSMNVWLDTTRPWRGGNFTDVRTSWRWDGYAALESDRMAFGLYGKYAPAGLPASLQWDLYGKRPDAWRLSLDQLEDVDYHQDNPIAVDFLLVGDTMGLGGPTIGNSRPLGDVNVRYEYREITDGPIRSGLEVRVVGWDTGRGNYDATIRYYVYAHHDFIDAGFTLSPPIIAPDGLFGVGLRRLAAPDVFIGSDTEGILAVMGQQEGIVGRTGMAVLFEPEEFARWGVRRNGDASYVVHLDPIVREEVEAGAPVAFYRTRLVGVWSEGGIANVQTMAQHCRDLALRFRNPVTITR